MHVIHLFSNYCFTGFYKPGLIFDGMDIAVK